MSKNVTPVSPARLDRAETAGESYKRVEDKILGLKSEVVGRVTADIPIASSIALGAKPNLEQLRPDFEQLNDGGTAVRALDQLEDLALAVFYANLQYLTETSIKELGPLVERARIVREITLDGADFLSKFGIFNPASVVKIREGAGNLDLAKDLISLGALYTSNWEQVANKVPFGIELVNEAAQLGPRLLRAIGAAEVGEVRKDPSYDWDSLRARAFRLLVLAYEELRRAAAYVRWFQGDAKLFAPTLHPRLLTQPSKPATTPPQDAELPSAEPTEVDAASAPVSGVAAGLKGSKPFAAE